VAAAQPTKWTFWVNSLSHLRSHCPVRLFLEAKFRSAPCDLKMARNALGVIQDVNQNYASNDSSRTRRRFHYCYALFSTSGFTDDAQDFALAHQLSLVDLSGQSFAKLRATVGTAAQELRSTAIRHEDATFSINWLRGTLRALLGTDPLSDVTDDAIHTLQGGDLFAPTHEEILNIFAQDLRAHTEVEILLARFARRAVHPPARHH